MHDKHIMYTIAKNAEFNISKIVSAKAYTKLDSLWANLLTSIAYT